MMKILQAAFVVALLAVTSGVVTASTAIGVNFVDGWPAPMLAGETADGLSNWTDSGPTVDDHNDSAHLYNNGTGLVVLGSNDLVTCDWTAPNTWAGGSEGTSEQQLYRVYLDDGGDGSMITVSGLSDWLLSEGMSAYTIRIYHSTDWTDTTFEEVNIVSNGEILQTVQETNHWSTDGGTRAFVDSGILTADTIIIDPAQRMDDTRACIAGFQIIAVPEPATLMLLGLGGLVLGRKRS